MKVAASGNGSAPPAHKVQLELRHWHAEAARAAAAEP